MNIPLKFHVTTRHNTIRKHVYSSIDDALLIHLSSNNVQYLPLPRPIHTLHTPSPLLTHLFLSLLPFLKAHTKIAAISRIRPAQRVYFLFQPLSLSLSLSLSPLSPLSLCLSFSSCVSLHRQSHFSP